MFAALNVTLVAPFVFNTKDFWTVVCIFPTAQEPLQNCFILARASPAAGRGHWEGGREGITRFCTLILPVERGPTCCQKSQKSLLLTGTFIVRSIPIQWSLAADSGFQCLGLVRARGRILACLTRLLFTSNRTADDAICSSLWSQVFRYQLESKAEGNQMRSWHSVTKDKTKHGDGFWGLFPFPLLSDSLALLCFHIVPPGSMLAMPGCVGIRLTYYIYANRSFIIYILLPELLNCFF